VLGDSTDVFFICGVDDSSQDQGTVDIVESISVPQRLLEVSAGGGVARVLLPLI
jgi:hypothetical protein